ncbi:NtaA/DmoA family FMN-dependent monooxygenase [Gordonia sp. VNK21]|uniref:NtaA/DmoA family FMN-dependent monooxygenase n=1 Tax=Gordonia sp. VNK21 TaxID=3382483 RepID=UPI0038D492A4
MTGLHLNLSLLTPGHFRQAWRLPEADPLAYLDVDNFVRLARLAEDAKLDAVFLGDAPALRGEIASAPGSGLDPLVLLGHVAARTERVGVVITSSSTFNSPYNLARRFQTLDHVTKGRAAVNIVTTAAASASANFGLERHPGRAERYRRATEFLEVVTGLWDGWQPDWLIADKESGRYADTARIGSLDHRGEYFSVAGPLPTPPGPQGRPVLVQAGGSAGGLALAGRFADVVFTVAQTADEAVAFRSEVHAAAVQAGRGPEQVKVSLGVVVLVGRTDAEAQQRLTELAATLPIERLGAGLLHGLGLDPRAFGPDDPITAADLPDELPDDAFSAGFSRALRSLIAQRPVTPRELVIASAGGSGHRLVVGGPETVAADLRDWYAAGAADGFTVMPADSAVDAANFTGLVVPLLQEWGLFRRDYPAGSLRDRLFGAVPADVGG